WRVKLDLSMSTPPPLPPFRRRRQLPVLAQLGNHLRHARLGNSCPARQVGGGPSSTDGVANTIPPDCGSVAGRSPEEANQPADDLDLVRRITGLGSGSQRCRDGSLRGLHFGRLHVSALRSG